MAKPLKGAQFSSNRRGVLGQALLPISPEGKRMGNGAQGLSALAEESAGIFYRKAASSVLTVICLGQQQTDSVLCTCSFQLQFWEWSVVAAALLNSRFGEN